MLAALPDVRWWRRLRAGHGPVDTRRRHATMFGAALAILALALLGPLDWVGERRPMAAHMVQHVLVVSAAPALLLFGVPRVGWPHLLLDAATTAPARTPVSVGSAA